MQGKVDQFREKVNLNIYDKKYFVLTTLRILRVFFSFLALGAVIYYYGFPVNSNSVKAQLIILRLSFAFFIFSYIVRFFFDFEPRKFLRENKIEGIILLFVLLDGLGFLFLGQPFLRFISLNYGVRFFSDIFIVTVQLFLIAIVWLEIVKMSRKIGLLKLPPSILFILSFLLLIFIGAGLLMMPEMTVGGVFTFSQAIFTSTSASCVTGLIVVDTGTFFTLKGQIVIMILMQIGGLNMITFASFFAFFSQKGVGLKQQVLIMDFMSFESLQTTKKLLGDIILMALSIELVGAVMIYFTWHSDIPFHSFGQKVYYSIFHSISAFNNAGFSLFKNGLFEPLVRQSYMLHIVIGILIVIGGLGFPVLYDLFSRQNLRERLAKPWKQPKVNTKLVVVTSVALLIAGAITFYILEERNPNQYAEGGFAYMNFMEKLITSFFQSVTLRTAGFNTVDFSILSPPVLLFFIGLMFIGASPASTGGGIKTTTFALIFLSAISTIRNRRIIEIFKFTISEDTIKRAYSIVLFSTVVIFTSAFTIAISDPHIDIFKIFFEVVSAFCTVGLSTGITAELSQYAQTVLIVCMFIGRVGILTLAIALSKKALTNNYKYPNTFVMVG
jgi:potassium uptake TrkH family protein